MVEGQRPVQCCVPDSSRTLILSRVKLKFANPSPELTSSNWIGGKFIEGMELSCNHPEKQPVLEKQQHVPCQVASGCGWCPQGPPNSASQQRLCAGCRVVTAVGTAVTGGQPTRCVCQVWATGSKAAFCFHTPGTCLWEEEPSSSRAGTDRAPAETSMAEGSRAARWARPLLSDIHSYPLATCCDRKIVGVQLCED